MALILEVKVVPRAGRQKCVLDTTGRLKCYIMAAPEGGKANAELLDLLRKALKISKNQLQITLGATARLKRIAIDADLTFEDVCDALGIERQLSIA